MRFGGLGRLGIGGGSRLLRRLALGSPFSGLGRALLRLRLLFGLGIQVHFRNRLPRIVGKPVVRIAMEKIGKHLARLMGVVQVVFVDFTDRKQRIAAVLAAGVFLAQKPVLRDGFVQDPVVIEATAHLDQNLGHGHGAGIGFGGGGSAVVDVAIRVDHALVVVAGAFGRRTTVERLAHTIGGGVALA